MHYSCAIHKPSATRSQLLIFSTLATALLFETRGLVERPIHGWGKSLGQSPDEHDDAWRAPCSLGFTINGQRVQ